MSTQTQIPVTVYAESTPNPDSMRFVANRLLIPDGAMLEFNSAEEADGVSPLASKVFNLPFVESVFISNNFVTVSKNNKVTWDLVQLELREYIQDFLRDSGEVVDANANTTKIQEAVEKAYDHAEPKADVDKQIIMALDEYVRPAVEGDGGHIAFHSFKDGIVTVTLRGSCSGCPSSAITLKSGIETLLKQMVPEVKEVIAEEL
jgi:Fe-S cluster biogenesis protein NfuA